MIPSTRLAMLALLPLALALAALAETSLLWPMMAVDAALVLVAALDAWLGRGRALDAGRILPRVFSVGRDNRLACELRSHARRTLDVDLRMDMPDSFTSPDLPVRVRVAPGQRLAVMVHVRPGRRGKHRLGDLYLRHATPGGLWLRQLRVPADDLARVYPDVRAVRTYDLLARQNRETLLARAARLRGGESEFERLRDHGRDDPYRAIDWKATARRQRLTVREYQKERDQTVMCLLDCGRLMTAEADGLSYLDHALNATLMLGHVAARTGDQVGLLAFDERVRVYVPPAGGPHTAQRLVHAAHDVHPVLTESNFGAAFDVLSLRVRKRALVVLFTQVVDDVGARELARLVRVLPARHLTLCILLRDPALDQILTSPDESLYTRAAAAETVLWRDRLVRELKGHGASVLHPYPRALTPALVTRYLEIKAKQLL